MNSFELYLNSIISDSVDTFGINKVNKFVDGNINDYLAARRREINIYKNLIPFLREKYQDDLYELYNKINKH